MRKSLYAALASTLLVGCAMTEPVYALPTDAYFHYDVSFKSTPKVRTHRKHETRDYWVERDTPVVKKRYERREPQVIARKHYRNHDHDSRRW